MATTVSISPEDLPDAVGTLHDDGSYEISITGLTGLLDVPRPISRRETELGILSANPPTIRVPARRKNEIYLLMLRATEKAVPDGVLDNVEGVRGALDKEHCLLAQLSRVVARVLWALEKPE